PANTPWDKSWAPWRDEVVRRMRVKAELAAKEKIVLFHENEHNIFGDAPDRVADLITAVNSPSLRAAYDAANFVHSHFDPVAAWEQTKDLTSHIHIKDWTTGAELGCLAGTGDGNTPHSTANAVQCG